MTSLVIIISYVLNRLLLSLWGFNGSCLWLFIFAIYVFRREYWANCRIDLACFYDPFNHLDVKHIVHLNYFSSHVHYFCWANFHTSTKQCPQKYGIILWYCEKRLSKPSILYFIYTILYFSKHSIRSKIKKSQGKQTYFISDEKLSLVRRC